MADISMRHRLLILLPVPLLAPLLLLLSGCDEVPRGEQGIDFLIDGSPYSVPSGHDAGRDATSDAEPPCIENAALSATCANSLSGATPAPHVIVCAAGSSPAGIVCVPGPDASADAGVFCCTTGLL
jgi:hypothetical protein